MFTLDVSSKRASGSLGVVGKAVLIGLVSSASAMTQASMLSDQSVYLDNSCGSTNAGARHGGSRSGCNVMLNDQITEGNAGSIQLSFAPSATVASQPTTSIVSAPLGSVASAKASVTVNPAAPGTIAPVVTAPGNVVPAVVATPQIVAPGPTTTQPTVTPSAPTGGLPAPTVSVLAVPEPGTMALLLGGFIALIGIRHSRSSAAK